jgi:hypothetical protein
MHVQPTPRRLFTWSRPLWHRDRPTPAPSFANPAGTAARTTPDARRLGPDDVELFDQMWDQ